MHIQNIHNMTKIQYRLDCLKDGKPHTFEVYKSKERAEEMRAEIEKKGAAWHPSITEPKIIEL